MIQRSTTALCLGLGLAGCDAPVSMAETRMWGEVTEMTERSVPAVMLVRFDDGTEEVLRGTWSGPGGDRAGLVLTGPTWGECRGAVTPDGKVTLRCATGREIVTDQGPRPERASGVRLTRVETGGRSAVAVFGWGEDGTEAAARKALLPPG